MAIVWPCPLAVDAYPAAGRDLGFLRPDCPSCAGPLVFWSGVPAPDPDRVRGIVTTLLGDAHSRAGT